MTMTYIYIIYFNLFYNTSFIFSCNSSVSNVRTKQFEQMYLF